MRQLPLRKPASLDSDSGHFARPEASGLSQILVR